MRCTSNQNQQMKRSASGKRQTMSADGRARKQQGKRAHSDGNVKAKQAHLRKKRKRRQQRRALVIGVLSVCLVFLLGIGIFFVLNGTDKENTQVLSYETAHLNKKLYQDSLFAEKLCVTTGDVALEGFPGDASLHAAGLFDIEKQQVLYGDRLFDRLYPASTTKVMTALLVLKYGNLDDIVTVSENALNLEAEATVCGLQSGDKLSLYDLLCGLVIQSGNDSAVAIAEHMFGSVEAFAQKMNEEALILGATGSNFTNPHGLHDMNHYTTAYDLYLMFNACLKYEAFQDIISMKSYASTVTGGEGSTRVLEWYPTNYYSAGITPVPEGVTVFGGKTGTTNEAGSCVILYSQNEAGNPFISLVMGASDKEILYQDMSQILTTGVAVKSE